MVPSATTPRELFPAAIRKKKRAVRHRRFDTAAARCSSRSGIAGGFADGGLSAGRRAASIKAASAAV